MANERERVSDEVIADDEFGELEDSQNFWLRIRGTEPALIIGFVTAVLSLVMAFGVNMDPTQEGAILGVVVAGLTLLQNLVPRQSSRRTRSSSSRLRRTRAAPMTQKRRLSQRTTAADRSD